MPQILGYEVTYPTPGGRAEFKVDFKGEGGKGVLWYASMTQIRDAIELHQRAMVKDRKLGLPVVTDLNELRQVAGVALRSAGMLTGIGKANTCYPDVDWLVRALQLVFDQETSAAALKEGALELRKALQPFRVNPVLRSRQVNESNYGDCLDETEQTYKRVRAKALEEGPPLLVAKALGMLEDE